MARFVSPPIDQLSKLRQPLTRGERLVFDFFDSHLDPEWEIYIQPHLNGLRPDFVLLHPNAGIAVFEIKDWDLDAMEYRVEERPGKPPILIGIRDGNKFSLQDQNPIEKLHRYKQEIYELYCPRLKKQFGFAAITSGVIFPFANDERVKELLGPCLRFREMENNAKYNPISGSDTIQSGKIRRAFPESIRCESCIMTPTLAQDLRNWLVEPDYSQTQRQELKFDHNQGALVNSRTSSGYRKIKGPAGSGKSLVLAARAAKLLSEGKEVLVVTFNITLIHYLMDISVRWPHGDGSTRKDITWLNFHHWCKRVCLETDHEEEYKTLWKEYFSSHGDIPDIADLNNQETRKILSEKLPRLVESIIIDDTKGVVKRYDAVLVDEGQDFLPIWWNVLRRVCKKGGEMLLVADATQDIYGTARSWTDEAMKGAGFPGGRWAELKVSYRLPQKALQCAREFAQRFLPSDIVDLPISPQEELDLFPCKLRWVQTDQEHALDVCREEILQIAPSADPKVLAISDITFLAPSRRFGGELIKKIGGLGIKVVHTFGNDSRESRRLKMGFYMGDARIKATTLHSFKGWESRALVLYISNTRAMALVYTGLTRLKRHTEGSFLTVVSSVNSLAEYGKTWQEYKEKYQ
ncbi:MAG: NERD domain-containing protein/DEAD/DEAH box helicase [Desulfobaccales bacterium]|nr:NERD domain-containing protein/DEAD/DEAH box helicase [Desulfobaccales bacterium]